MTLPRCFGLSLLDLCDRPHPVHLLSHRAHPALHIVSAAVYPTACVVRPTVQEGLDEIDQILALGAGLHADDEGSAGYRAKLFCSMNQEEREGVRGSIRLSFGDFKFLLTAPATGYTPEC